VSSGSRPFVQCVSQELTHCCPCPAPRHLCSRRKPTRHRQPVRRSAHRNLLRQGLQQMAVTGARLRGRRRRRPAINPIRNMARVRGCRVAIIDGPRSFSWLARSVPARRCQDHSKAEWGVVTNGHASRRPCPHPGNGDIRALEMEAGFDLWATPQIDDGFRFAQPILRIRGWNIGAAVITLRL
jgi:hypothetical protein